MGKGLRLPAWASLTMISARGSFRRTVPPRPASRTSPPYPPTPPAAPTRPDAVQPRQSFGEPLLEARTGRGALGYSWMLVPWLLRALFRVEPRIRGSPRSWGDQGAAFREVVRTAPLSLLPAPLRSGGDNPGNAQGRDLQSHPESWGRDFPKATEGPRGGPEAGRRADEGAGGLPPGARGGFLRGWPTRGLTVQGQEVPAQVHARRAVRR